MSANRNRAGSRRFQHYSEMIQAFGKVKRGMPKSEVTKLLGEPTRKTDRDWQYDFAHLKGFPGLPPPVGAQVFLGGQVHFDREGLVENTRLSGMDATGPAPK